MRLMPWTQVILDHVRPAAGADFPAHLRALAAAGDPAIERWGRAELEEEAGLEIWACRLAALDRRAGATAAAAAARHVLPVVLERAGEAAIEYGISEEADAVDGEPEAAKVGRVEAWLAAPGKRTLAAVKDALDPSRQLEVWDDDLLPADHETAWAWFTGVGQLCAASVTAKDGSAAGPLGSSSYGWPARVCAARCVVSAAKCLVDDDRDAVSGLTAVGAAIAAAFGL
jgi:hypothetical protein